MKQRSRSRADMNLQALMTRESTTTVDITNSRVRTSSFDYGDSLLESGKNLHDDNSDIESDFDMLEDTVRGRRQAQING